MSAKIKSLGFIVVIFVTCSVVYYEIVIQTASLRRQTLGELKEFKSKLISSDNEEEIIALLAESDTKYQEIVADADILFNSF